MTRPFHMIQMLRCATFFDWCGCLFFHEYFSRGEGVTQDYQDEECASRFPQNYSSVYFFEDKSLTVTLCGKFSFSFIGSRVQTAYTEVSRQKAFTILQYTIFLYLRNYLEHHANKYLCRHLYIYIYIIPFLNCR